MCIQTLFSNLYCCYVLQLKSTENKNRKKNENAQRRQTSNFITFGNLDVHIVKCFIFIFLQISVVCLFVFTIAIEWKKRVNFYEWKWQRRIIHSIDFDFAVATHQICHWYRIYWLWRWLAFFFHSSPSASFHFAFISFHLQMHKYKYAIHTHAHMFIYLF